MGLNVGFLGYGLMGSAHANALARLPMFFPDAPSIERRVLIGRDENALTRAADRLGFDRTSTNWREALEAIDVLYNLAPNHLHPEPSIAALKRGVHVLCEKPLANSLESAEKMAQTARECDTIAGMGFNYRFVPALRYAKQLIESGELGAIRTVRGRYLQDWLVDPAHPWSWRNDRELAGSGALGDLGSHTVDLIRYLVGDHVGEIRRVSGSLRTFIEDRPLKNGTESRPVTVDDAFTAQLQFESDAIGTVEGSRMAPGHKNDHSITIHGSSGSLRFGLERLNELEVIRERDRGYQTILVTEETDPFIPAWWPPGHVLGWEHTFVHENAEFLAAIDGNGSYRPDFDDGFRAQRILDGIQRSSDTRSWIDI